MAEVEVETEAEEEGGETEEREDEREGGEERGEEAALGTRVVERERLAEVGQRPLPLTRESTQSR